MRADREAEVSFGAYTGVLAPERDRIYDRPSYRTILYLGANGETFALQPRDRTPAQ